MSIDVIKATNSREEARAILTPCGVPSGSPAGNPSTTTCLWRPKSGSKAWLKERIVSASSSLCGSKSKRKSVNEGMLGRCCLGLGGGRFFLFLGLDLGLGVVAGLLLGVEVNIWLKEVTGGRTGKEEGGGREGEGGGKEGGVGGGEGGGLEEDRKGKEEGGGRGDGEKEDKETDKEEEGDDGDAVARGEVDHSSSRCCG